MLLHYMRLSTVHRQCLLCFFVPHIAVHRQSCSIIRGSMLSLSTDSVCSVSLCLTAVHRQSCSIIVCSVSSAPDLSDVGVKTGIGLHVGIRWLQLSI